MKAANLFIFAFNFYIIHSRKNGQLGVIGLRAVELFYVDALVVAQVAMTLG